jgi:hypothetical protein
VGEWVAERMKPPQIGPSTSETFREEAELPEDRLFGQKLWQK